MKTFSLRFACVLTLLGIALYSTSAGAMGRSGAIRAQESRSQATERLGRMEADRKGLEAGMQAQIDTLRKELAELKAQLDMNKGMAAAP